jgi:hypothetical protein
VRSITLEAVAVVVVMIRVVEQVDSVVEPHNRLDQIRMVLQEQIT